ncbi:DUF1963 domain-containing protein [Myceligenerans pegani]|uniref:DUF1963 domain-containing protein n=1 Tax=Myceligenerans pegani TaxID=2776917 RepID=A0ABR9N333_9MICO|nr:DUF1963 domain-containing protein [Myceligenerans sp. TRM 65318]MBE1878057.1 DUF1963 domain-containing protein [Myceligenerans sp. TRM 65318]MBE3020328.1 DUF1963 domain-containing protein [Myceligenerans sp. TRM 65318]
MHPLPEAVRAALAPLLTRSVALRDQTVDYVLDGSGRDILATLPSLPDDGAALVARPGAYFGRERIGAVAALHPGWTQRAADDGRYAFYLDASVDALVRFGRVLTAVTPDEDPDDDEGRFRLLVADVARVVVRNPTQEGPRPARLRWQPRTMADLARAGGVPAGRAPRLVLSVLLDPRNFYRYTRLLDTPAGHAFLSDHHDVLPELAAGLGAQVKGYLARLCASAPDVHGPLLGDLAVDEEATVRDEALAMLAWLDAPAQVGLLAPRVGRAEPTRSREAALRLADLDGGLEALDEILSRTAGGSDDVERALQLRELTTRARTFREPAAGPSAPAYEPPDEDLLEEVRAQVAHARGGGTSFGDRVRDLLPRLPDVRILRDALAAAGASDADRRVAGCLLQPRVAAEVADHADRWWPLFAERLDLVAEYLGDDVDGYPSGAVRRPEPGPYGHLDYERWVDTPSVVLTVLERFPVTPEPLVPRLAGIAVGRTRYRHAARRALASHPGAAELAAASLHDGDPDVRRSAAEWHAALGDATVVAPEPGWELPPGVSAHVRSLPRAVLDHIDLFRQEALGHGVPRADVDRWLALARPDVRLGHGWDGPVAARQGSPLMLPSDVPVPADRYTSPGEEYVVEHQLLATIDLAAIPPGHTDIPLPPDGHLLLFANPDLEPYPAGSAVYVPAGTPVVERETALDWEPVYEYDSPEDLDKHLRSEGELRVGRGYTLPDVTRELEAEHPHARRLMDVWGGIPDTVAPERGSGAWRIGGHAFDHEGWGDPARRSAAPDGEPDGWSRPEDWVLLAQWDGLPMASVYWTVTRQDLAARRFDRVVVAMYSNP